MELVKEQDLYSQAFESLLREVKTEPEWLRRLRVAGMEHFTRQGFPSRTQEEWRFTDFRALARTEFLPERSTVGDLTATGLEKLAFSNFGGIRLVFVNGEFRDDLSNSDTVPGLTVASLDSALRHFPELVEGSLGKQANAEANPFVALNTALARDGFFIHVEDGTAVAEPVQIVHVTTAAERAFRTHLRNLVLVGDSAELTLVECYLGNGPLPCFSNPVTEVVVGANSTVRHYRLQNEGRKGFHVGSNDVQQARHSSYRTLTIDLGAALTRNDFRCVLAGEGGLAGIDGLYLLNGDQHLDNYTTLEHVSPHCDSRELFKGILDDRARGIFRGRIIVHKGAQKTDSKQTNNNLLLSDEALVNTKPQLEIYADDVKCTHGATIGQLDSDALFYLRSRAISEAVARGILIYGFASEVIERVKVDSLRDELVEYLASWLPEGELVRGVYSG